MHSLLLYIILIPISHAIVVPHRSLEYIMYLVFLFLELDNPTHTDIKSFFYVFRYLHTHIYIYIYKVMYDSSITSKNLMRGRSSCRQSNIEEMLAQWFKRCPKKMDKVNTYLIIVIYIFKYIYIYIYIYIFMIL